MRITVKELRRLIKEELVREYYNSRRSAPQKEWDPYSVSSTMGDEDRPWIGKVSDYDAVDGETFEDDEFSEKESPRLSPVDAQRERNIRLADKKSRF